MIVFVAELWYHIVPLAQARRVAESPSPWVRATGCAILRTENVFGTTHLFSYVGSQWKGGGGLEVACVMTPVVDSRPPCNCHIGINPTT